MSVNAWFHRDRFIFFRLTFSLIIPVNCFYRLTPFYAILASVVVFQVEICIAFLIYSNRITFHSHGRLYHLRLQEMVCDLMMYIIIIDVVIVMFMIETNSVILMVNDLLGRSVVYGLLMVIQLAHLHTHVVALLRYFKWQSAFFVLR